MTDRVFVAPGSGYTSDVNNDGDPESPTPKCAWCGQPMRWDPERSWFLCDCPEAVAWRSGYIQGGE